ncbi:unnamed protein product [Mytilus edulis]|uniref:SGNH hydrolase-type esterase domain-containing protein n=1 Tax=Mytilus edulis TaxID=6550 RepID=A0A8S3UD36_MYTED|nr:unnamed protein product [Mytilus edulis]
MYRFKKVSITTLRDKTVQGAKEFLETGKINAKNILFQVGSNDLEAKQPTNVVEEIEQLIVDTKKSMPESQIIISQILPRFYRNQNMDQEFEVKRVECNQLLYELCKQYEAYYVQHENLTQVHFQDGIHLNKQRGIKLYVRNLKEIVNPLIGVKNDDQDNSRNHHVREKPDGAPNYTRYRQPNKMYNDSVSVLPVTIVCVSVPKETVGSGSVLQETVGCDSVIQETVDCDSVLQETVDCDSVIQETVGCDTVLQETVGCDSVLLVNFGGDSVLQVFDDWLLISLSGSLH